MSCLHGRFNADNPGYLGPLLVTIGVSRSFPDSAPDSAKDEPSQFMALIDTGASHTSISPKVVEKVGLSCISMIPMVSATDSGGTLSPVYIVDLYIYFGPDSRTIFRGIQVTEFSGSNSTKDSDSTFDILLGRDILCKGVFTLSFDGHFTFSL